MVETIGRMRWVDSDNALEQAVGALTGAKTVYLDTEFDSSRRGTIVSLIQISNGKEVFVVDALELENLEPLGAVLRNPDLTWVLHAGSQDVALLCERANIRKRPRVLDTQMAWALLSAEYSVSLPYLAQKLLGERLTKGYQADDWLRRPLPEAQVAYAAMDVQHLPALERSLEEKAARVGRMPAILAASAESVWPEKAPAPKLSLEAFRNAWQLDGTSQAALLSLIDWYNVAEGTKLPPGIDPKALLSIASRMPESVADLARIKGVPRFFVERHGAEVIRLLKAAANNSHSQDFITIVPSPYATFEQLRLDAWLGWVRAELCASLEVSPEAALPQRVVRQMRDAITSSGEGVEAGAAGLTGWRRELLLESYLAWCKRLPFDVSPHGA